MEQVVVAERFRVDGDRLVKTSPLCLLGRRTAPVNSPMICAWLIEDDVALFWVNTSLPDGERPSDLPAVL